MGEGQGGKITVTECLELFQKEPLIMRNILAPRFIRTARSAMFRRLVDAEVIIGITVHNNAHTIRRCLESVQEQGAGPFVIAVLILDDSSTDNWASTCQDLLEDLDITVLTATCGSSASARNAILDYVSVNLPKVKWVARLDGDDRLTCSNSLRSMCETAESGHWDYVIGGNRLVCDGKLIEKKNPVSHNLFDTEILLNLLSQMADGTAENELPSCNLLLSPRAGWRYLETRSAEDHWLVATLLIHYPGRGTVSNVCYYSDYSLNGSATTQCQEHGVWNESRKRLYEAAKQWVNARSSNKEILGFGNESVVYKVGSMVEKHFFPWTIDLTIVRWLQSTLPCCSEFLPNPNWELRGETWVGSYPYEETRPVSEINLSDATEFLLHCLSHHVVCKNIKRSNFRRRAGGLLYVDLGESIIPMDIDYFRDSASRLYAIAALGYSDDELRRRQSQRRQTDVLHEIEGLDDFYTHLLMLHASRTHNFSCTSNVHDEISPIASNVTLMIKACAMDAQLVAEQSRQIVSRLQTPRRFSEVVLLIDSFEGPFLRAYDEGDLPGLLKEAQVLLNERIIDRILIAPRDPDSASDINNRWFDIDCPFTHTAKNVPLTPQLWGFEQIQTRYLLQCDIDTLVGRTDPLHDYLTDMLDALQSPDVFSVAFNIPHGPNSKFRSYDAPIGEFVPEVRCGLLDLERIHASRPFPNYLEGDKLSLSWYRSIQKYQQQHGLRSLRGGDPRSHYVHPPLNYKSDYQGFARIRDLVGQSRFPAIQQEQWDLKGGAEEWSYRKRPEDIVFLLRGRGTSRCKIRRCISSLTAQDDQDFGVISIDDATGPEQAMMLQQELKPIWERTSLVNNSQRMGHIRNTIFPVRELCTNPTTLVVILDQDDALMDKRTVSILKEKWAQGHDVILAAMFRPDKPMKIYHPDFCRPRDSFGGEVWIHLRSFRKSLFELIPTDAYMIDNKWITACEDYAMMIPMIELSQSPVYIPMYLYYHERSMIHTPETRHRNNAIIKKILDKMRLN